MHLCVHVCVVCVHHVCACVCVHVCLVCVHALMHVCLLRVHVCVQVWMHSVCSQVLQVCGSPESPPGNSLDGVITEVPERG